MKFMQQDRFEYGATYHICNRGINREDIFKEEKNYAYFLSLMKKYLLPVADIYAYCLMKNHYHLLLRFKEQQNVLNPVKHNFSSSLNYPHSSYEAIISDKPTNLDRETVIDYFEDKDNFILWHDFKRLQHQKLKELTEDDY